MDVIFSSYGIREATLHQFGFLYRWKKFLSTMEYLLVVGIQWTQLNSRLAASQLLFKNVDIFRSFGLGASRVLRTGECQGPPLCTSTWAGVMDKGWAWPNLQPGARLYIVGGRDRAGHPGGSRPAAGSSPIPLSLFFFSSSKFSLKFLYPATLRLVNRVTSCETSELLTIGIQSQDQSPPFHHGGTDREAPCGDEGIGGADGDQTRPQPRAVQG